MKRLLTLTCTLATLAALSIAAPAIASAASCSPSAAGGEKAPALSGPGIAESALGGYSCTVAWRALVTPQYEVSGVWHTATEVAPRVHGDYAAGSGHNWLDGEWDPTATADTPACSVRWRLNVDFVNTATGSNFQSTVSALLAATC